MRPLEFTQVGGELWAAVSRHAYQHLEHCEGEVVDIILLDDLMHIHGLLTCSTADTDRAMLWNRQHDVLSNWCTGADDPDFFIIKVMPDDFSLLDSSTASEDQQAA